MASDPVGMRPAERQLLADTLAQSDRLAFWQETLDQAPCLEPEVYADSQWDAVIRSLIEEQSTCLQALLQEAARSSEQQNENQNDQRIRRFEAEVCLLRSCEAWINALPDLNRQDPLRVYLANQLVPVVGKLHQWLVIEDAQGSERGEWFWQGYIVMRCCCQKTEGLPPWWEPVREQLVRYAALEWLNRTQTEAGESRFEPEAIVRTLVLFRALSTLHEPTPIWIVQALHETLRYGFAPLLSVESLGGDERGEALLQSVLNWLNLLESTEKNPKQTTTRERDQTCRTDSLEAIWDGLQRTELTELVPEHLLKKLEELQAAAVQTEISTQPAAPTMMVERKDLEQEDLQSTTAAAAVENETPIASPSEGAVLQNQPEDRTAMNVTTAPRQNVMISMGETLLLAGLQEQALEVLAKGLPEWVPTEQRASHARLLASQMLVRAGLWKEAEALHAEAVRAIDSEQLSPETLAAELEILRTESKLLSHELNLALSQGSLATPAPPGMSSDWEQWRSLSHSKLGAVQKQPAILDLLESLNDADLTGTGNLSEQQISHQPKGLATQEQINTHLLSHRWIQAVETLESLTGPEVTSLARRQAENEVLHAILQAFQESTHFPEARSYAELNKFRNPADPLPVTAWAAFEATARLLPATPLILIENSNQSREDLSITPYWIANGNVRTGSTMVFNLLRILANSLTDHAISAWEGDFTSPEKFFELIEESQGIQNGVLKIHRNHEAVNQRLRNKQAKAVLTHRNMRDCCYSYWRMLNNPSSPFFQKNPTLNLLEEFLQDEISCFQSKAAQPSTLIISEEDIRNHAGGAIQQIITFLGISINPESSHFLTLYLSPSHLANLANTEACHTNTTGHERVTFLHPDHICTQGSINSCGDEVKQEIERLLQGLALNSLDERAYILPRPKPA
jgi:hypothetical protein